MEKTFFQGRYLRTEALPHIGPEGQRLINEASLLIIGCGALGNSAAMYAAAAGAGHIVIADPDTVETTNLQRQVAFAEADRGLAKAQRLKARMKALNSGISVVAIERRIEEEELTELLQRVDFALECTDSAATKYMVSRVCRRMGKPLCLGGVREFTGQIYTQMPDSPAYSELFPCASDAEPPAARGVFGPVAGIVGAAQAAEALKYFAGAGNQLAGKLLTVDTLNWQTDIFSF